MGGKGRGAIRSILFVIAVSMASCIIGYLCVMIFTRRPQTFGGSQLHSMGNFVEEEDDNTECCRGIDHLELWGEVVKWGTDFKFSNKEECCSACKDMCKVAAGPCLCNSWVFCGDKKMCKDKFGEVGWVPLLLDAYWFWNFALFFEFCELDLFIFLWWGFDSCSKTWISGKEIFQVFSVLNVFDWVLFVGFDELWIVNCNRYDFNILILSFPEIFQFLFIWSFPQCWLKMQNDALMPETRQGDDSVVWTSGLIFGKEEVTFFHGN